MKNNPHAPTPPHWADQLLRWRCPQEQLEEVQGDLHELFHHWVEEIGETKARWRYGWNVLTFLRPLPKRAAAGQSKSKAYSKSHLSGMLRNYLTITLRNLLRQPVFSFINIASLSAGLACCILIFLYTKDEVSFDRFHQKKDQLFQLTCQRVSTQGEDKRFAMAAMVQGPAFRQEIPEIQEYVRVNKQDFIVRVAHETFPEKGTWVDENFFSVFSFPLLVGDPQTVLSSRHSVVLSEETAQKYFGTTQAVGKKMELELDGQFEPFIVSGIAKKPPQNSSIQFTLLLPFQYLQETHPDNGWMWVSYPTYLLLNPTANPQAVAAKMARVFETQAKNELAENKAMGYRDRFIWGLQPMVQMHLAPEFEGTPQVSNPIYAYVLTGIAIFILLIACINFVNLTLAQSLKRRKEIGIRKVMGSQRSQLVGQFLGESLVLCFLAFLVALALAQFALPLFNELANKKLRLDYLLDFKLVAGFVALFLLTGLAAGFYPALVLSGINPVQALYKRSRSTGKNYLAKGLVVVQFSLATFLIIVTLFVYAQFDFLTNTNLGYDDHHLLEVTINQGILNKSLMQVFQTEFSNVPGVTRVAARNVGRFGGPTKAGGREFRATYEHIDEQYLPTMQIPLVAGRNFSKDFPADSLQSVLVNEAFVKAAGWQDPIGHAVDFMNFPDWGNRKVTVVGVVKDYHSESLKEKIQPQVFTQESRLPLGKLLIRLQADNLPRTLKSLEQVYQHLIPDHPFQYDFKEAMNERNYEKEAQWKQIITFGAMVTIFISCIGLFGMTRLSIGQQGKEIAIRKVLGASVLQISSLVSKNFVGLVLMAMLVALPAGWYVVHRWLENFAYKIDLSWPPFAWAALFIILLALLTVSYSAIRAAVANPVKSLSRE